MSSLEKCPFEVAHLFTPMFRWTWSQRGHCPSPTETRLSAALRATFGSLAEDQGVRGSPRSGFPCPPGSLASQGRGSARSRRQCFLTVWVTARVPSDRVNQTDQKGPSLCLLSPCPLAAPAAEPGGLPLLSQPPAPIHLSHLHEKVQKMSFYIINYILQVIKILQSCP